MKMQVHLNSIFATLSVVLFFIMPQIAWSQMSKYKYIQADKSYHSGNYSEAEMKYGEAAGTQPTFKSEYNIGNTMYKQGRIEEAILKYEAAANLSDDPILKAQAHYNAGNGYMQLNQTEKAISKYKQALRINPADLDTKKNLTKALQKQAQQKKQQEQQEQQEQQQDKNNQKDQQQQQNQGNQPNEQNQGDNENNQDNNDKPNDKKQDPNNKNSKDNDAKKNPSKPTNLSKEEAETILRIMKDEEQKVRAKMQKGEGRRSRGGKEW